MQNISRRDLTKLMSAAGLSALIPTPALAQRGEQLVVVQWGAAWIEVAKKITDGYVARTGDRVAWELHAGGAMAIVAKIKAAWPRPNYNVVSGWDPVFRAMIKEDWLEPVSLDELPALRR